MDEIYKLIKVDGTVTVCENYLLVVFVIFFGLYLIEISTITLAVGMQTHLWLYLSMTRDSDPETNAF